MIDALVGCLTEVEPLVSGTCAWGLLRAAETDSAGVDAALHQAFIAGRRTAEAPMRLVAAELMLTTLRKMQQPKMHTTGPTPGTALTSTARAEGWPVCDWARSDRRADVRAIAAAACVASRPADATTLAELAIDPDWSVRTRVAVALRELPASDAATSLLGVLARDPHPTVRQASGQVAHGQSHNSSLGEVPPSNRLETTGWSW